MDGVEFCTGISDILKFVGYIFIVFKIVIPLILIILGSIDLGKAVISSKEDEVKKATSSLLKRAIAGIVIFFLPTIIGLIFGLVDQDDGGQVCIACVTDPGGPSCTNGEIVPNNNTPEPTPPLPEQSNVCYTKTSKSSCEAQSECIWETTIWDSSNYSCVEEK